MKTIKDDSSVKVKTWAQSKQIKMTHRKMRKQAILVSKCHVSADVLRRKQSLKRRSWGERGNLRSAFVSLTVLSMSHTKAVLSRRMTERHLSLERRKTNRIRRVKKWLRRIEARLRRMKTMLRWSIASTIKRRLRISLRSAGSKSMKAWKTIQRKRIDSMHLLRHALERRWRKKCLK